MSGSVALNTVPPVTLPPAFSFAFTGFQSLGPPADWNSGPYFQVDGSTAPALTAPGSGLSLAPLSLPAGAASGNFVFPASGLFAYGSALGAGSLPARRCLSLAHET